MNTRADRDTKLHAMGFRPDEAYIKATYGEGWKPRAVRDYAEQQRNMPASSRAGFLDF
ncbi:MAG: hypothetical protein KA503_06860 [Methyloversatilis sp.]|jgi:hypothetical protein|nr:hypothetical protein [Methyloversatilis sp.]